MKKNKKNKNIPENISETPHKPLVGPAEFVYHLLGEGKRADVSLPLTRTSTPGGALRMSYIAQTVKQDAFGWLCRRGGWKGRVWDKHILPYLHLRFTAGPLHLLIAAMQSSELPVLSPSEVLVIQSGIQGGDPATGDLLALHRIVEKLSACPSCNKVVDPAMNEHLAILRSVSPLTLVFSPEEAGRTYGTVDEVADAFAPLFIGDRGVLFSYLDEELARAWLAEEGVRWRLSPDEARDSYAATVRGLQGFIQAAQMRPDALRPVIAFFYAYIARRFGARAAVVDALRSQAKRLDRISEQEAFLHEAAGLFALGRVISGVAERAQAAPYVDRTEEEKVLLADYNRFHDIALELEAIRRELSGEMG